MLLLPQSKLFLGPYSNYSRLILMGSKNFLLLNSSPTAATHARIVSFHSCSSCLQSLSYYHSRKSMTFFASPKHIPAIYQKAAGFSYTPYAAMPIPRSIPGVDIETPENQMVDEKQLMILKHKLQEIGFDVNSCLPGQYTGLMCPNCKGGDSGEKSLSLMIEPSGAAATWTCFRGKCGWKGATRAFADVTSTYAKMSSMSTIKQPPRIITEESLGLEPLCNELLAYFAERMISGETLRRNSVMQKKSGDRIAIAFTYRRDGDLVSCKYCDITKIFWQEANTEKIFYGLDDIKEASDVIIVEGEMNKLALEEAGFKNCASVPDSAPPKVSKKSLPSDEEDTNYQYLWNCKDYTQKASRIVLAMDADAPGQALSEELARRLGRERCWRVRWPKKNETEVFKDANEVLMYLGPDALRDVIGNAELCPIRGLSNFKDYNDEIDDYYHQRLGFELGVSTGWRAISDLYNETKISPFDYRKLGL